MVSIGEYTLKRGLDDLTKLGYDKIKLNNIKIVDTAKRNSLITIFNDNKAQFTVDGVITPDTIKSFINITYSGVIPATFKTLPNIKKLVEILGYIITLVPDLSVTSRVIPKQPK